jgi:hypothetical protein
MADVNLGAMFLRDCQHTKQKWIKLLKLIYRTIRRLLGCDIVKHCVRCHNPEDLGLNLYRRESLKFRIY